MLTMLRETRDRLTDLTASRAVATLSGDDSVAAVRELGIIRRLVEALTAEAVARIDATDAHRTRGDRSAVDTCAKVLQVGPGPAAELLAAAKAAADDDRIERAFRNGEVDARSAAMIGAVSRHVPDAVDELLDAAVHGPQILKEACARARAESEDPEERARRLHAARELRIGTDADGMVCGRFRLTPEVGGRIKALIDAGAQRRFRADRARPREHHAAHAADELATLLLLHAPADGRRTESAEIPRSTPGVPRTAATVHVVIDHSALVRGRALAGETCEIPGVGPIDARWARDLLGDAFLTAVIKHGTDITTVAHFGRHVNARLRTALLVQGRECDVAGCGIRGYLEMDHVRDHAKRGPTALHNLGWLCSHHHRLKSSGWILGPRSRANGKRRLTPPQRAPSSTRVA